jgi:rubredoxin
MDWKCPQCGTDNEEVSIKCPCGYLRDEPDQVSDIASGKRKISSDRTLLRWSLLILTLVGGLYMLNAALFCAWASSGPPTDYPKAWLQRSYIYFGFSGALIATGMMGFIGLKSMFNWRRSALFYMWVLFLVYCLAGPKVREFLLIDKCMDSGGMWDRSHFDCRN